jgi:Melibiase
MFTRREFVGTLIASAAAASASRVNAQAVAPLGIISNGSLFANLDPVTGLLTLEANNNKFAFGKFMEPQTASYSSVDLGADSPFGSGQMLKVSPGENRIVISENAPFVFIRRDPRSAKPVMPGNQVSVYEAQLNLGVSSRGLGAGGLYNPVANPGQHVVTAIADPASRAGVVAGLVRIDAASGVTFTSVVDNQVTLTLRNDYGSAIPPTLDDFGGDWWAIGWFADVRDGLEAWADQFARINQVKLKPHAPGYCTWYSDKFGAASDPEHLQLIAEFAAKTFAPFGFSFVQIDDHWQNGQKRNGWPAMDFYHVNPQGPYAAGMQPIAKEITSLGLLPGIWMLPFAIDDKDPVFADKLDLVVHRADGTPYDTYWGGTCLDMTNPVARDYVAGFISQAVHQWGYGYLKIDGQYTGLACLQDYPNQAYVDDKFGDAVFMDKTQSNMQAARLGLKTVREAAGPDTFILGCCLPQNERSLGMLLGLVDAQRVGPDNTHSWANIQHGTLAGSHLYFLNGRIWWNDPDPIYARPVVPMHEFLCYGSWVTLLSAHHTTSDWMPEYTQERIDALRCMMPSHQFNTVRPVDIFENDPARIWVLTYTIGDQKHQVLGLFNWSSQDWSAKVDPVAAGLDPKAIYDAFDFWGNKPISGLTDWSFDVPARSCLVLALRPRSEFPGLVSTSRHVTQGAVDLVSEKWDASTGTLSGVSRVVGGSPYELRFTQQVMQIVQDENNNHTPVSSAKVSAADIAAGVQISTINQADGWARVTIESPTSREVQWTVSFVAV